MIRFLFRFYWSAAHRPNSRYRFLGSISNLILVLHIYIVNFKLLCRRRRRHRRLVSPLLTLCNWKRVVSRGFLFWFTLFSNFFRRSTTRTLPKRLRSRFYRLQNMRPTKKWKYSIYNTEFEIKGSLEREILGHLKWRQCSRQCDLVKETSNPAKTNFLFSGQTKLKKIF